MPKVSSLTLPKDCMANVGILLVKETMALLILRDLLCQSGVLLVRYRGSLWAGCHRLEVGAAAGSQS